MGCAKIVTAKKKEAQKRNKSFCHDCGKEVKIEDNEIVGGHLVCYDTEEGRVEIVKCFDCFSKNPSLTNYRKCEVYSRIVGYLRPIQQWNEGKQEEFEKRVTFKLSKKCS